MIKYLSLCFRLDYYVRLSNDNFQKNIYNVLVSSTKIIFQELPINEWTD